MTRQRMVRVEQRPSTGTVLVRALYDTYPDGRAFDRQTLIDDVELNFTEFGYYGLSLWLVTARWPLERVLAEKARKARRAALFDAGALLASGLGLVPSGKHPHYDATHGDVYGTTYGPVEVTAGSASALVDQFLATAYDVISNDHYQQDPS